MKRFSIIIISLLFIVSAGAQRTFVVLTGISNYGIENANLGNTTKDVKELKQIFDQQNATVSMLTSSNVTHDNIVNKLKAVVLLATEKDNIIFYFSGHGDTGGFISYGLKMFKYSELIEILSKAKTKNVFCFIDACMSGSVSSLLGSTYSYGSNEAKIVFMMSSRADELSSENSWLGNGYFTNAMAKGLRGKADTDGDKKVTLGELFNYVYKDVTNRTHGAKYQQHPQLIGPKGSFNTVLTSW
ncbi:MAG: caspase family protein [Prevotella sp.]|nr:caspase family protein [Prevotella sp.]